MKRVYSAGKQFKNIQNCSQNLLTVFDILTQKKKKLSFFFREWGKVIKENVNNFLRKIMNY